MDNSITTIDEYIAMAEEEDREALMEFRRVIHEAAPEATEKISYQMPTFYLHGNLVHFAAFKGHYGFYPAPTGIEAFKEDLSKYKGSKGAIQFPKDKPLPIELIERIVKFRVEENVKANEEKKARKKS
ncbi:iron chaperone [Youngiibacter multivorans]|uniref:Uncharacterized protein YdhG (YjbR/CyaY superfamily) n=1 Tax=Youngiibacter multivorans TaxID=937251 RepID=A0ABS4G0G9_9CLOT|nr:DUF1801 domain-containing protein [Youngiibacter multivorans]MBP1918026.1 uncharacterized protein YdhG (YjbR/CyaY superfamily) [Youngiibacter multivorans]